MIVVVGLAFEARIAAGPGVHAICSGDGRNLASSLASAIRGGCGGLVSFGVAGGLHPDLQPGDCIVASTVVSDSILIPTDRRWSQHLIEAVPGAVLGVLVGVRAPVATPWAKQILHRETGAIAVDMESHVVASVAARHAIPMVAMRVVTDPAVRALPTSALRWHHRHRGNAAASAEEPARIAVNRADRARRTRGARSTAAWPPSPWPEPWTAQFARPELDAA